MHKTAAAGRNVQPTWRHRPEIARENMLKLFRPDCGDVISNHSCPAPVSQKRISALRDQPQIFMIAPQVEAQSLHYQVVIFALR